MVIVSTVIVSTIGQQTKLFTMVLYNINGWPIMTGTKSWYETALNGIDILSMFSFFSMGVVFEPLRNIPMEMGVY